MNETSRPTKLPRPNLARAFSSNLNKQETNGRYTSVFRKNSRQSTSNPSYINSKSDEPYESADSDHGIYNRPVSGVSNPSVVSQQYSNIRNEGYNYSITSLKSESREKEYIYSPSSRASTSGSKFNSPTKTYSFLSPIPSANDTLHAQNGIYDAVNLGINLPVRPGRLFSNPNLGNSSSNRKLLPKRSKSVYGDRSAVPGAIPDNVSVPINTSQYDTSNTKEDDSGNNKILFKPNGNGLNQLTKFVNEDALDWKKVFWNNGNVQSPPIVAPRSATLIGVDNMELDVNQESGRQMGENKKYNEYFRKNNGKLIARRDRKRDRLRNKIGDQIKVKERIEMLEDSKSAFEQEQRPRLSYIRSSSSNRISLRQVVVSKPLKKHSSYMAGPLAMIEQLAYQSSDNDDNLEHYDSAYDEKSNSSPIQNKESVESVDNFDGDSTLKMGDKKRKHRETQLVKRLDYEKIEKPEQNAGVSVLNEVSAKETTMSDINFNSNSHLVIEPAVLATDVANDPTDDNGYFSTNEFEDFKPDNELAGANASDVNLNYNQKHTKFDLFSRQIKGHDRDSFHLNNDSQAYEDKKGKLHEKASNAKIGRARRSHHQKHGSKDGEGKFEGTLTEGRVTTGQLMDIDVSKPFIQFKSCGDIIGDNSTSAGTLVSSGVTICDSTFVDSEHNTCSVELERNNVTTLQDEEVLFLNQTVPNSTPESVANLNDDTADVVSNLDLTGVAGVDTDSSKLLRNKSKRTHMKMYGKKLASKIKIAATAKRSNSLLQFDEQDLNKEDQKQGKPEGLEVGDNEDKGEWISDEDKD